MSGGTALVEMQCLPERIWRLQSPKPEGVKLGKTAIVPFNKTKAQEVCKCNLQSPCRASASLPAAHRHREARSASFFDSRNLES